MDLEKIWAGDKQSIRLMMGELSAQEMRSVQALLTVLRADRQSLKAKLQQFTIQKQELPLSDKSTTRFDLETAIMESWQTSDDIDLVSSNVMDDGIDKDQIANTLVGLKELHDMRVQRVFDIFTDLIHAGKINDAASAAPIMSDAERNALEYVCVERRVASEFDADILKALFNRLGGPCNDV